MKQRTPYILSIIIAILATIASAGGLLLNGLYRDNAFVTTTWLGNDAVTRMKRTYQRRDFSGDLAFDVPLKWNVIMKTIYTQSTLN